MNYQVTTPSTKQDWQAYYDLRWEILRKPWQQPKGSEKDDHECSSYHCMIKDAHCKVLAIGRIHLLDEKSAQIRYMAVAQGHERQGFGKQVLQCLESFAAEQAISIIRLHARENVVGFYEKQGYSCIQPSHTLFGSINHFLMAKHSH